MAVSSPARAEATAASRSRQKRPTPPLHSRSRDRIASASAEVTAGVTRLARAMVTSEMETDANPTEPRDEHRRPCDPGRCRRRSLPELPSRCGDAGEGERGAIGREAEGQEEPAGEIAVTEGPGIGGIHGQANGGKAEGGSAQDEGSDGTYTRCCRLRDGRGRDVT